MKHDSELSYEIRVGGMEECYGIRLYSIGMHMHGNWRQCFWESAIERLAEYLSYRILIEIPPLSKWQ